MPRRRGFTLIELMIVVAIIGILAAIAVPKFADLIRKSREGATKGTLGSVRSALQIYYADNEGRYPAGAAGSNITYLQSVMTGNNGKYLSVWPTIRVPDYHRETSTVDGIPTEDAQAADASCDGEWAYVGNESDRSWGKILVECYSTDTKGSAWTSY